MKKLTKIVTAILLSTVFICASTLGASAMSITDGIKAEINVISTDEDKTTIEASVKNANYYGIDGINYEVSVSDNASLLGETKKTNINLDGEQTDSVTLEVSTNQNQPSSTQNTSTTSPATESTNATTQTTPTSNGATMAQSATQDSSTIKTGDNFTAVLLSIIVIAILAFAIILFTKKRGKNSMLSIVLCLTISASMLTVALGTVKVDAADGQLMSFSDTTEIKIGNEKVTLTLKVEYPQQSEIHDNTMDDLKKLNGDNLEIIYNDKNQISFLNGKYTDYKVTNWETALSSLQALQTLLNIKENGLSLVPIHSETDGNGDIYYSFQQNSGTLLVNTALLKIGVDKDGKVLCLSSAIQPDIANVKIEDNLISKEEAIKAAEELVPQGTLVDKEPELAIDYYNSKVCWNVYKEIRPDVITEGQEWHITYLKVSINAVDKTLANLTELMGLEDNKEYDTDEYFDVVTQPMEFKDAFGGTVTLPVATTSDGKYYVIDTERKIYTSETLDMALKETELSNKPYTFSSAEELSPVYVTFLSNFIKVYDYFNSIGIKSVDGLGHPIKICLGVTSNGVPIDNAYYMANTQGFATFACGNYANSMSLDVAAHEFTHGIRANTIGGLQYSRVTGAIEESYADIIGNLIEMTLEPDKCDTEGWLVGEQSGYPLRSMSNPNQFSQPAYVGDVCFLYAAKNDLIATDNGDNGGVHINSGVLNNIAYKMSKNGLSFQDNLDLWLGTLQIGNTLSTFDDIRGYLKYIAGRYNKSEYKETIQQLFKEANAIEANTDTMTDFPEKEGYRNLSLTITNAPVTTENWVVAFLCLDSANRETYRVYGNRTSADTVKLYVPKDKDLTCVALFNLNPQGMEKKYKAFMLPKSVDLSKVTLDYNKLPDYNV